MLNFFIVNKLSAVPEVFMNDSKIQSQKDAIVKKALYTPLGDLLCMKGYVQKHIIIPGIIKGFLKNQNLVELVVSDILCFTWSC